VPPPALTTGDPDGWEDPPRRRPPTDVPVLSVDGFEGPVDWLLEMVRAHKIDLARLSILALVEAFATALRAGLARRETGSATPLWRWGDWLVMAANLALLRSRLLLPADTAEATTAHDEVEAIVAIWSTSCRWRRRWRGWSGGRNSAKRCSRGGNLKRCAAPAMWVTLPTCCAPAWWRCGYRTTSRSTDRGHRRCGGWRTLWHGIWEVTTAGETNTRPLADFLPAINAD